MPFLLSVFQGKEPKIEEFTPPGWYRNAPRGWAAVPRCEQWRAQGGSEEPPVRWKAFPSLFSDEDCPLRDASSRKIPKLTVKVREGQLFTCSQGPSLLKSWG